MKATNWQSVLDPLGNDAHQFIAYHHDNHRKVSGCVWIPEEQIEQNALVAFLHGMSGSRFQAPIPYCARKLATLGVATLALDGPVHGLRRKLDGGRIALYTELAKPKAFDRLFRDWDLAIQLVEDKLPFPVEKFAYFGLSMGTFFGVPYLANRALNDKSTQAAVLGILGTTGVVSPFRKKLLRDARSVQMPLIYFIQSDDQMFRRDGCLELFHSLASRYKELRENPGKHGAVPVTEFDYAIEFLRSQLE